MSDKDLQWYLEAIRSGQRRGLAKALTLVESSLPAHRAMAQELLAALGPSPLSTLRVGVSGVPGVGKSTFLESFGLMMIAKGFKVAVLSVDPSSPLSGGSILGDKTRMLELSRNDNAFIRPSPAGGELGGVASRSREALALMEAAGYNLILVETVGVGQSEVAVAGMTDFFLLLCLAGAGDELQGVKKGILELVDCAVINKVDQVGQAAANRARAELSSALRLGAGSTQVHGGIEDWQTPVLLASGLNGEGLEQIAQTILAFDEKLTSQNLKEGLRKRQDQTWLHRAFHSLLWESLKDNSNFQDRLKQVEKQVAEGELSPNLGAEDLVNWFNQSRS